VAVSCAYSNEPLGSIKGGEFEGPNLSRGTSLHRNTQQR
jgi:hypothetical protein